MTNIVFFIASGAISAIATQLCIRFALQRGLLDHPNERSSHSQAVPRVGGVGMVLGFFLPLLAGWGLHVLRPENGYSIVIGLGGMAAIGLWDDLRSLTPGVKYALQLSIAALLVASGLVLRELSLPSIGTLHLGLLAVPLSMLWLTGFPNFFNFMDGINGMAGGSSVIYGCFLAAFAWFNERPEIATIGLLLAGSSLGFLLYNFPSARTFMGDTGSMFLGLGVAMLAVLLTQDLVPVLILCSVFIFDCVTTIARRLRRGENIFRAHRNHHYQRLVQGGWSHTAVSTLYFGMNCIAGGLGVMYLRGAEMAKWAAITAIFVMLLTLMRIVRSVERKKSASQNEEPAFSTARAQ